MPPPKARTLPILLLENITFAARIPTPETAFDQYSNGSIFFVTK